MHALNGLRGLALTALFMLSFVRPILSFTAPNIFVGIGRLGARTLRPPSLRMQNLDDIPDAIVEAEAKATPMRPVRQQAFVLLGAASGVEGV